jgi:hypothetical protein
MKKLIALLVLGVGLAQAQTPREAMMWAVPDCGHWIRTPNDAHKTWLAGYLSAMNATLGAMAHKTDVLKDMSPQQAYVWMDNYCKANPLSDANEGGNQLWSELVKRKAR